MRVKNFTLFCLIILIGFPGMTSANIDTVEVVNNDFIPANITINAGDTIIWINMGTVVHTTTSGTNCTSDGMWDSGNMQPNDEFMFQFTSAGTFPYYCIPHCAVGMTGQVTVQSTVGVDENFQASLEVFPNPVKDEMKLKWSSSADRNFSVKVYGLTGREVALPAVYDLGSQELRLNTSGLKRGVYIVKFIREEEVVVQKFHKI